MILTTITNISDISTYESLVDGFCIPTKYSDYVNSHFEEEKLLKAILKVFEFNKTPFVLVNGLYSEEEIQKIEELISNMPKNVHYMFSDLGVLEILKEKNLTPVSIYDPKTMITNSLDATFYLNNGLEAVAPSLEITTKDTLSIAKSCNNNIMLKVFGYHPMLISKRKLISTYFKYKNIDNYKLSNNSKLVEQTRQEVYPIIENSRDTTIYRTHQINYIKELEQFRNIKYFFLNDLLTEKSVYFDILSAYSNYINLKIDKESAISLIEKHMEISDGFMYKDSVYREENFNEKD